MDKDNGTEVRIRFSEQNIDKIQTNTEG